eukprot:6181484-Pleurochrysis_carterae.AAC.3
MAEVRGRGGVGGARARALRRCCGTVDAAVGNVAIGGERWRQRLETVVRACADACVRMADASL